MIKAPKISLIRKYEGMRDTAELLVTIHEGRNRQIRRMCANAGMRVTRLIRIQEGILELGNLPCGKWRYLTQDEFDKLK